MENVELFIKRVILAVRRPKSYPDFGQLPFSQVFAYVAVLLLLVSVLAMIRPMWIFTQAINQLTDFVTSEVPEFDFKNGELQVFAPMPIIREDPKAKSIVMVDTTTTPDMMLLKPYQEGILIGKSSLIKKDRGGKTQIQDLSVLKGLTFSKETTLKWLPRLQWLTPLLIVLAWVKAMIVNFVVALLLCWISALFNFQHYPFQERYKMGLYALTLSCLLDAGLSLIGLTLPLFSLLYFVTGLIYMGFALQTERELPAPPPPVLSPYVLSMMEDNKTEPDEHC